jgi:hypothetical protein
MSPRLVLVCQKREIMLEEVLTNIGERILLHLDGNVLPWEPSALN